MCPGYRHDPIIPGPVNRSRFQPVNRVGDDGPFAGLFSNPAEFSVGKDRHGCRFALKRLGCRRALRQPNGFPIYAALGMDRSYSDGTVRRRLRLDGRVRLDASIGRLSWPPVSFPLRLQPQSSARFAPEENSISI